MSRHNLEPAVEAFKATPPLSVAGLTLFGVELSDWVILLTIVYLVLQIGFTLRDKLFKGNKNEY